MSQRTWERNTTGMVAHARQRAADKAQRVHATIDRLQRKQQPINFNAVATAAGVSKSYLYGHSGLRERIEALRQLAAEEALPIRIAPHQMRSDARKDVLLAAKGRRIKELEAENRRLQEELRIALGKLYEQL